eukprot:TRINITY_DN31231_c0_g1_i1.p1 TRINITY_DN31231_c0_g1~~TRINITY_DN31231_c0_g1_i1.p1  ORF type:complete len:349 (+),score=81.98 TRINITY_DN31231_c0_g1_i1:453-1499(+)
MGWGAAAVRVAEAAEAEAGAELRYYGGTGGSSGSSVQLAPAPTGRPWALGGPAAPPVRGGGRLVAGDLLTGPPQPLMWIRQAALPGADANQAPGWRVSGSPPPESSTTVIAPWMRRWKGEVDTEWLEDLDESAAGGEETAFVEFGDNPVAELGLGFVNERVALVVKDTTPGSPAHLAGLDRFRGRLLIRVNGLAVGNLAEARTFTRRHVPWRDGPLALTFAPPRRRAVSFVPHSNPVGVTRGLALPGSRPPRESSPGVGPFSRPPPDSAGPRLRSEKPVIYHPGARRPLLPPDKAEEVLAATQQSLPSPRASAPNSPRSAPRSPARGQSGGTPLLAFLPNAQSTFFSD